MTTESEQIDAVLQIVWNFRVERGRWPTSRVVDNLVDRELGLDFPAATRSMPGLLWPDFARWRYHWLPDDQNEVGLTVAGLLRVPGTEAVCQLFVECITYLVAQADEFEPAEVGERLTVDRATIASAVGVEPDDERLAVVGSLLRADAPGLWAAFSGGLEDDWAVTVDERGARQYRGIASAATFATLTERRKEAHEEAQDRQLSTAAALVESGYPELDGTGAEPQPEESDPAKVFVVHGRNAMARHALDEFLRSVGLHPIDFEMDAIAGTGTAAPHTSEILHEGFRQARAVVVLFTPDEVVSLRPNLRQCHEDHQQSLQARPNVYLEAGMALVSHPRRTVLVELGDVRVPSDIAGRHVVRMDDTEFRRRALLNRLDIAGCDLKLEGSAWLTAGRFNESIEG